MQITEFFSCEEQGRAYWLCKIKECDWKAGQYLHKLLSENKFADFAGENSKVLLLTQDDELISFCTYAEKDEIQPTELTPLDRLFIHISEA